MRSAIGSPSAACSQQWRMADAGIAAKAVADFIVQVEGAPREKLRINSGLARESFLGGARKELRHRLRMELGIAESQPVVAVACRLVRLNVSYAQAFRVRTEQARLIRRWRAASSWRPRQAGLGGSARWRWQLLAACDLFCLSDLVFLEAGPGAPRASALTPRSSPMGRPDCWWPRTMYRRCVMRCSLCCVIDRLRAAWVWRVGSDLKRDSTKVVCWTRP